MPQTPQHTPDPSPGRPRVGLFLVPAHQRRAPLSGADAWHGLDPHRLAWLIRHYTRAGDVVLDLDAHPSVARAAGLRYHQHLPVLLVPLPDTEPRTDPATAATTRPALLDGQHARVHLDVLAFGSTTTNPEATDA